MAQALPVIAGLGTAYGAIKGGGDVTTQTIDPATQARYDDLYNRAKGVANQPFVPYTGPRVAGFNPDQLQSFDATRNMFNQSMSYDPRGNLNQLGYQQTPTLLNTDLAAYQNPYQTQVIDNTLGDLNRARQMQIQSDQDAAIGRGAFGGSRSALLEAETNRNFADRAGNIAANLRSQGFDRATDLAGRDINNLFRNRQFQSNIFGDQINDQFRTLGLLSGAGLGQQRLQQGAMDRGYGEFQRALNYGPQQLGLLSSAVFGMNPGMTQNYDQGLLGRIGSGITSLNTLFGKEGLFS
tara:strand:- start:825 stop:1709 length:885 start_codon:yes stop_codon:yes gene_type:complete